MYVLQLTMFCFMLVLVFFLFYKIDPAHAGIQFLLVAHGNLPLKIFALNILLRKSSYTV